MPNDDQLPGIEYTAQAFSPLINGDVRLSIDGGGLTVAALFDVVTITYAEINAIETSNLSVTVRADSGEYIFSHLGSWSELFYDELCDAYNKAVLRSLFISGRPIVFAKGDCSFDENGATAGSAAPVHVYENNVTALPPNLAARRVPLCFLTGLEIGNYELTLKLDTGESYTYARLGYETQPFVDAIDTQIRKMRENTIAAVREIDPSLTTAQASQLVRLVPRGAAAPIGVLAEIAPSFTAALERKITATRANETYLAFREICDPSLIWIGFKKDETPGGEANGDAGVGAGSAFPGMPGGILPGGANTGFPGILIDDDSELPGMPGGLADGMSDADGVENEGSAGPDPYLLWMIAPSPDGRFAAVEFAMKDSATFVYNTGGDFATFARKLNHALEAINFRREVIQLSDAELRKPEYAAYYMAAKRTKALQFVRANFKGRVIHSRISAWKRKLEELWN